MLPSVHLSHRDLLLYIARYDLVSGEFDVELMELYHV